MKPPTAHIEQDAARKVYEARTKLIIWQITRHIVQSCFAGKQLLFSGGEPRAPRKFEEVGELLGGALVALWKKYFPATKS